MIHNKRPTATTTVPLLLPCCRDGVWKQWSINLNFLLPLEKHINMMGTLIDEQHCSDAFYDKNEERPRERSDRGRFLPLGKKISLLYILRIVMLLLFSATMGRGCTGVIREPRHRPLLLVSYRTARIRELPPPADWPGH